MYNSKNRLFKELLNNIDDNFQKKEELISLHKENNILASNIKIRKEIEKIFAQGKLKQIENELDQLNFEKQFAKKRNEEILEKIIKENYYLNDLASESNRSEEKLKKIKDNYIKYFEYQFPIIKNELNAKLLMKQNELISLRAIKENQLFLNQQRLELENNYYDRIFRQNKLVNDQLKEIIKENGEMEIENLKKRQEEEFKKREEQSLKLIEDLKKERDRKKKLLEEEKNKKKEEIEKIKLNKEKYDIKLEEEIKIPEQKLSVIEEEKEKEEILRSKQKPLSKSRIVEEYYYLNDKNHKKGKIDQIRQKKVDYLNESLRQSKIINKEDNFSLKNSQYNNNNNDKLMNQMKKSEIIYNEIKNDDLNENENEQISKKENNKKDFNSNNYSIKKEEEKEIKSSDNYKIFDSSQIKKEDEKSQQSISKKEEIKLNISKLKKEESEGNISKLKKEESEGNISKLKNSNIKSEEGEINNSEISVDKKQDLNSKFVSIEDKIVVLKKLISKIEAYSKTQKPGNYIYIMNITNTENKKDTLKNTFYELLNTIKNEPQNINNVFSNLEITILLNLFYEILHSNPNYYLNPENIKNNQSYSEKDFDKDLDKSYKIIFDLCLEHLKKMYNEKRVSLPTATNFLKKALINFNADEIIESRLLIVLEQKFKKKKQPNLMSNTFSGGFNVNSEVLTQTFNQGKNNFTSNNFNFEEIE